MHFNNPIPRSGMPRFSESSSMRPLRDSGTTGQLWKKASKTTAQTAVDTRAIQLIQRKLEGLRRRVVGGAAGSAGNISNIARYYVYGVNDDYLICKKITTTGEENTNYAVAKPMHLRHGITSQFINGINVSYSSYGISGGVCTRIASATNYANQSEIVLPVWQLKGTTTNGQDGEILAVEVETSNVNTNTNVVITLIDLNVDARKWCTVFPTELLE
jgi:hypothetical protein